LKSGFYNTAGGGIRIAILLATIPALIRILGIDEYGLWVLVSATLGVLGILEGGLTVATTVFASEDLARKDDARLSQTVTASSAAMLLLATLAASLVWCGADLFGQFFPALNESQKTAASDALQISAFVIWLRLLHQVPIGIEQACQRYGLMNLIATNQSALSNFGMVIVAAKGGHIVALMKWQVVVALITFLAHLVLVVALLRDRKLRLRWSSQRIRQICRFSGLTWASTLGTLLFSQFDRLIVGAMMNTSSVGAYAAITQVTAQINALSALPAQPLLPATSETLSGSLTDRSLVVRRTKQAVEFNALLAFALGAWLVLFAPQIVSFILPGTALHDVVPAFQLAAILYAVYSINAVGYFVLLGMRAVGLCTGIVISSGILSLALIGAGCSVLGLPGAIAGNAGYAGTVILTFIAVRRLQIPPLDYIRWLRIPLVWFVASTVFNALVPDWLIPKVILCLVQGGVLLTWFLRAQGIKLTEKMQALPTIRS